MSSLHIYLNGKVKDKKSYKEIERNEKGRQWTNYYVAGTNLFYENGEFYIRLSNIEEPIPEMVSDIAVSFSCYDWIPSEPKRTMGIYKHESASAILENRGKNIEIRINAKKIEDLRELYNKIRTGKILPSESWEVEQTAKGIKEKKSLYIRFRDFILNA